MKGNKKAVPRNLCAAGQTTAGKPVLIIKTLGWWNGRHEGLKILCPYKDVRVQVPPRAPRRSKLRLLSRIAGLHYFVTPPLPHESLIRSEFLKYSVILNFIQNTLL